MSRLAKITMLGAAAAATALLAGCAGGTTVSAATRPLGGEARRRRARLGRRTRGRAVVRIGAADAEATTTQTFNAGVTTLTVADAAGSVSVTGAGGDKVVVVKKIFADHTRPQEQVARAGAELRITAPYCETDDWRKPCRDRLRDPGAVRHGRHPHDRLGQPHLHRSEGRPQRGRGERQRPGHRRDGRGHGPLRQRQHHRERHERPAARRVDQRAGHGQRRRRGGLARRHLGERQRDRDGARRALPRAGRHDGGPARRRRRERPQRPTRRSRREHNHNVRLATRG